MPSTISFSHQECLSSSNLDVTPDGLPNIGEPFQIYNQQFAPPGNPLNVSGSGVTGLSLTFDDTGILSGIGGTVIYTGTLGSVSNNRRLIVERFSDATLTGVEVGQSTVKTNGGRYELITFDTNTWYLVAYLDVNNNRMRDTGEPFTIYKDLGSPPAFPVMASTTQTAIDITFGDDNITSGATPTATHVTVPSNTPTATPTSTPLPPSCAGDCSGLGQVTVPDLITLARIVLGEADASACPAGIPSGGHVDVVLITQAVNNAVKGCPP